jgi:hypothetical protein
MAKLFNLAIKNQDEFRNNFGYNEYLIELTNRIKNLIECENSNEVDIRELSQQRNRQINSYKFNTIKYGDVIYVCDEQDKYLSNDRNINKFMWDGEKIIGLGDEVDDYGNIPPKIEITDDNNLDAYSWLEIIDHNCYVWYSREIRDRMNFTIKNKTYVASVNIRGIIWSFKYMPEVSTKKNMITKEELKALIMNDKCEFFTMNKDNIVFIGMR